MQDNISNLLHIMGEDMPSLVRCEVISMNDLEEFSDETRETIERMVSW